MQRDSFAKIIRHLDFVIGSAETLQVLDRSLPLINNSSFKLLQILLYIMRTGTSEPVKLYPHSPFITGQILFLKLEHA